MQETQNTWVQSLDREDPLEEEMATHPSILARIISWIEEPGRVLSLGSQRVDTTESDWACTHAHVVPSVYSSCEKVTELYSYLEL